ncbi:MAG: P-loop NTPase fold protein [Euryarchaeota archaeon]|nr:P-loop NTPase fold protein [Euryarchaeota archaeon]
MQAQTLKDAIRVFDPRKTLDGDDLNKYHADRIPNRKEDPAITKLKTQLFGADAQKILFSGHRGCGKSTELNKLAIDLEKNHRDLLIVKYNVTDVLAVFDLDYSDVLFSLAYQLYHRAETIGVTIDKAVVNAIEEFVGDVTKDVEEIKEKRVGLGVMFQKLFVGKYQQERLTRETVRKQLKPRISRLIELINSMVVQIKLAGYDALIIIDGIDNSPLDIGKNLYGFGQVLSMPDCAIIYTIPISVVYSSEFTVIQQSFDKTVILPNITVTNPDGTQNEDGVSIFSNLSERRMRPDLIDDDALRYTIRMSAGITREFVRTIKDSCVEAIVRGGDQIICDDVKRAVADRKNDFKRMLSKKTQYVALKEVHNTKSIYITDEDIRAEIPGLLHNLSIVEYNGDIWWDVHPVVLSILESMDDHVR